MNIYNLKYGQFCHFISKIDYGYIDKKGERHLNTFSNPLDSYTLQYPHQLINSRIGLCFDIVELYRSYLYKNGYQCESYYMEYNDGDILESHAFIIHKKRNGLWFECVDNSWTNQIYPKGYYDKEALIKSIYEWFEDFVCNEYQNVDKSKFFLTSYTLPTPVLRKEKSLREYCAKRSYLNTHRVEHSGMAIVFCKGKVLLLETKHKEFVFPKGHIESGETSKDASIRECLEESGVSIKNAKYFGECGSYSYTFSGGHLKMPNDDFYHTFNVNSITKNIYVHVYELKEFQSFTLEKIFINGFWINIDSACNIITHDNTKEIFLKALELYKNKLKTK